VPVPLAVTLSPIVEFADGEAYRIEECLDRAPGLLRPLSDEIYNLIAFIRLDPSSIQRSPNSFFRAMCSVSSSAITSSF
jgi:hypothetical protein